MHSLIEVPQNAETIAPMAELLALVHRVASSTHFERSARLRDFLLYVCHQSLESAAPEISEQDIGVRVFNRPPHYDRSQDNIVRVNAGELRKRIEKYFEVEGAHESLIFTIPRGAYCPQFEVRSVRQQEMPAPTPWLAPPVSSSSIEEPGVEKRRQISLLLGTSCVAVLALVSCIFLWWQNHQLRLENDVWFQRPFAGAFWTDFVRSAPETDVVLPDASMTMTEEILGRPLSLNEYVRREFPGTSHPGQMGPDRQHDFNTIFGHNLVALGDSNAAQQLLSLAPIAPSLRVSLARFYEPSLMNRDNLILIGGRKANPWAQLFDEQLNFSLQYQPDHTAFVANLHPAQGEAARYMPLTDLNQVEGFSVVAYLPNLGNTSRVLLLAGTDSESTAASAIFLTSEKGLADLKDRLQVKRIGYFEALLKTTRVNGTGLRSELLAVRPH